MDAKERYGEKVYCPKCKEKVEYDLKDGIAECDTPVGVVQTVIDKLYCKKCGAELSNRALRDYNYLLMVKAGMGFWRKQNPDGTKKQCRRALGIPNKETVDVFWNICLEEVAPEDASQSNEKVSNGDFSVN